MASETEINLKIVELLETIQQRLTKLDDRVNEMSKTQQPEQISTSDSNEMTEAEIKEVGRIVDNIIKEYGY